MPMLKSTFALLIVLICFLPVSQQKFPLEIPKTLWVFWDSHLDKAPILVQLCVSKMRAVCQKQNWNLIVLNETNLHEYIPNYETQFMQIRKHAAHPDWKAAFSDLVRLHVIAANGGVYMDVTTILFQGLAWFDKLDQMPYLLTNSQIQSGVQPDCIVPYIAFYQNSAEVRDSQGRITNWLPGYEAWFLAGKKNALFIQKWRKRHLKHYQLTVQQNGKDQIDKGYFLRHNLGGDYLIVDKSAFQVIQEEQIKLDKQVTLFGPRKNVNKELKILGLHGQFGPFSLYLGYTPREEDFLSLTIQQVEEKHFAPIHFFVKLTNSYRNFFDTCFRNLKQISERFGYREDVFERFMAGGPTSQECNTVKFIVEGSVFGGLLQDNIKAQEQGIFKISTQQRDQFHEYCKSTYRIELKEQQFYDNLYYYVSRLIEVGELINLFHPWASWIKYKFDEYMKLAFRESILPPRNWMGWLVQPAETLYWEKRHQKILKQQGNLDELPKYHGLTEVYANDYSDLELLQMRIKMWVFEHRVEILTCVLHWIGFMFIFCLFSLASIAVRLIWRLMKAIYKYNIRPFLWLTLAMSQPEMVTPIKHYTSNLINGIKELFQGEHNERVLAWISKKMKSLMVRLASGLVGSGFLAYYTFILYNYDVVLNNGKIYEMEWVFLSMILLQISFRIVGSWLGEEAYVIPGIKFQFLYYLFLPVYYYFFGAELLSLVRPFENQNFSLAYYIAFCMPLIIKLIQHQVRFGIFKHKSTTQQTPFKTQTHSNSFQILLQNLYSVFSDLTGWMEKTVIIFLFMTLLTNLRFLRNSQGYILANFFTTLAQSKLPWITLLGVYCFKSALLVIGIFKHIRTHLGDSQELSQTQNFKRAQSNSSNRQYTRLNLFTSQINEKVSCLEGLSRRGLKSFAVIAKYGLRVYTIYILLFGEQIEQMVRHIFQINFDHTFMKITFMTVYFAFVFISFMVQIYVQTEFWLSLERIEESKNHQVSVLEEQNSQKQRKILSDLKYLQALISMCQIFIFILPRLSGLLQFYSFFDLMNKDVKFQKKDFQSSILLMVGGIFLGYVVLVPFLKHKLKSTLSNVETSRINEQNQLLPSEDNEIWLRQNQAN